jgi:nitronate monooxygenase
MVGLMALLPQVVDSVNVPVIATGGIANARGVAAVLILGRQRGTDRNRVPAISGGDDTSCLYGQTRAD